MTDREKLTNIVCGVMQNGCVSHCNYPPCYPVLLVVDALIANGVTVREWISVKDRLPEHGSIVVVKTDWVNFVCQWDDIAEMWLASGYVYKKEDVKYWFPLPEEPKEE
jgi:hypothetical protein